MIRGAYIKILFVPLLGIFLPILSGCISYELYSTGALILANLYFIAATFITWIGCSWIHSTIRPLYAPVSRLLPRLVTVGLTCSLFAVCIACLSMLGWNQLSNEVFSWNTMIRFALSSVIAVIIFTLVYEILYLSRERVIDSKLVRKLDRERSKAELHALQNEMDPHFMFNTLSTMNHLILSNPMQAHLYNMRLAQVYKYFLVNKNKELVTLQNELDFIDDYFHLLRMRHDDKLRLEAKISAKDGQEVMIPPCSLQILVENAIKHNAFSSQQPLHICIVMNGQHLKVINEVRPKPYSISSTRVGLKNLQSRYKLLCNKEIIIDAGKEIFTVKLPLIV